MSESTRGEYPALSAEQIAQIRAALAKTDTTERAIDKSPREVRAHG